MKVLRLASVIVIVTVVLVVADREEAFGRTGSARRIIIKIIDCIDTANNAVTLSEVMMEWIDDPSSEATDYGYLNSVKSMLSETGGVLQLLGYDSNGAANPFPSALPESGSSQMVLVSARQLIADSLARELIYLRASELLRKEALAAGGRFNKYDRLGRVSELVGAPVLIQKNASVDSVLVELTQMLAHGLTDEEYESVLRARLLALQAAGPRMPDDITLTVAIALAASDAERAEILFHALSAADKSIELYNARQFQLGENAINMSEAGCNRMARFRAVLDAELARLADVDESSARDLSFDISGSLYEPNLMWYVELCREKVEDCMTSCGGREGKE